MTNLTEAYLGIWLIMTAYVGGDIIHGYQNTLVDVIKWKHFPRYWPFVRGIHRSPVNSPLKGQWRGGLMFSLICALDKRLRKQSWGWWFEPPSRPLWRNYKEDFPSKAPSARSGIGTVNTFHSVMFSVFQINKALVTNLISHSYLIGVTPA